MTENLLDVLPIPCGITANLPGKGFPNREKNFRAFVAPFPRDRDNGIHAGRTA
jgi:hypothetical protein